MQTAVINTESASNLNASNRPHETMNRTKPFAFAPGYQSHPQPPPRTHQVLCYDEPGGVMCLEEIDIESASNIVASVDAVGTADLRPAFATVVQPPRITVPFPVTESSMEQADNATPAPITDNTDRVTLLAAPSPQSAPVSGANTNCLSE